MCYYCSSFIWSDQSYLCLRTHEYIPSHWNLVLMIGWLTGQMPERQAGRQVDRQEGRQAGRKLASTDLRSSHRPILSECINYFLGRINLFSSSLARSRMRMLWLVGLIRVCDSILNWTVTRYRLVRGTQETCVHYVCTTYIPSCRQLKKNLRRKMDKLNLSRSLSFAYNRSSRFFFKWRKEIFGAGTEIFTSCII